MPSKVLIVDDDKDIVDAMEAILEMEDYHVSHAYEGEDGIRTAEEVMPQLILLDYMLPDINGDIVASTVRSMDNIKHIPIILVSATRGLDNIAKNIPVDGYIEKPFDMEQLLLMVKKHIK